MRARYASVAASALKLAVGRASGGTVITDGMAVAGCAPGPGVCWACAVRRPKAEIRTSRPTQAALPKFMFLPVQAVSTDREYTGRGAQLFQLLETRIDLRTFKTPVWAVEGSERLSRPAKFAHQIGDDGEINHECEALADAGVFEEFVDFDGEQGRGRDDREIFSPALAQRQADAFGEKNRGIDKRAHAEFFQSAVVHNRQLRKKQLNVVTVGINLENVDPVFDHGCDVLVKKFECADADGE